MKAPFKRNTKLVWTCPCQRCDRVAVPVTYVKWCGFERSALIVVQFPDKTRATVHIDEVKVLGEPVIV